MPVPSRPTLRHAAAVLAIVLAAGAAHAAGLDIHADADAKDVGLPIYPGAVKKPDKRDEPPGFSFGVWGDSFGFKLAVVSDRSDADIDAVAAFYREALGRYGPVLDCSQNRKPKAAPAASSPGKGQSDLNTPVTCDADDVPDAGGRLFKVGTHGAQRAFRVRPIKSGVSFQLVRVEARVEE
ncbi:MAG: hypothetical protein ABJD97_06465 [Betaproteobacteria bacterium]